MKNIFFLLFLSLGYLSVNAQPYTFAPQTQTVSGENGAVILASTIIYRNTSSTATMNFYPSLCSGPSSSVYDMWIENGGSLVNGDNDGILVEFRFKKPTSSTASTETYKFLLDQSQSCSSTGSVVTVTVNYNAAVCVMNNPSNLASYVTSPTSARLDWTRSSSSSAYTVEYKKNTDLTWTSQTFPVGNCGQPCDVSIAGLTPNTLYNWRVKGYCQNGLSSGYANSSFTTPICSATGPTNLNATVNPYQGYDISFTPVTGTTSYQMEFVDLVTNVTGYTTIFYSSTPGNGNQLVAVPSNHSFKFRLQTPCSGAYSEWKTITLPSCLPTSYPTNLVITKPCGSMAGHLCGNGNFYWSPVSGAVQYEVQVKIYNLSGTVIMRTFTSTSNSTTYSNLYAPSGQAPWYLQFQVRAKCLDGSWSNFSDYTTPTQW